MEIQSKFHVVVTEDFKVDPKYTGLTQDQLDWFLSNLFWHGVSYYVPGYFLLTFHLPLPPGQDEEMTE